MKTIKELKIYLENQEGGNSAYYMGYKDAIEGIYKDIQQSSVLSIESIEKYLQDLLK